MTMNRVNELHKEKQEELEGLYAVVEEVLMKFQEIKETKGFHRLTNEHKEDHQLVETQISDFLNTVDDYVRGDVV